MANQRPIRRTAEQARGGEIILTTRLRRAIFLAGLAVMAGLAGLGSVII